MDKESIKNFAVAALSAATGRYISAGVHLFKNWKVILGIVGMLLAVIIVLVSVVVSLPGLMMQSLLSGENEKEATLQSFAAQEISAAESEKASFISAFLASITETDEEGNTRHAVLSGKAPSKEEVIILYMVKYGEYFDEKELDKSKIKSITRSFLKVQGLTVHVLPFETVVKKHNLSDEQIAIALNMYSSYMYDQTSGFSKADILKNLGNATYTNGATDVVYYSQRDERWAESAYGDGSIGRAGCGPTSLAMVVSSFGKSVSPKKMCDWAADNGYKSKGGGSYWSLIPDGAENFGLKISGEVTEGQQIVDALANGKLIIAIMGQGHFTSSGHFIVLRGVTEDGKIMVADSYSVKNTEKLWDLSTIWNEAKSGTTAGGPFWIISK